MSQAAGPTAEQAEVLAPGASLVVPEDADVPVGTVLAFAGHSPDQYQDDGWYHCRGQALGQAEYADLFTAIGYAFGRAEAQKFRLPDLRGWFIRSTSPGGGLRLTRDPDAARRRRPLAFPGDQAQAPQAVGSTQRYATAPARTPFSASVAMLNVTNADDDAGCSDRPGRYNNEKQEFPATGGDLESRPPNKYVHYLIKVRRGTPVVPAPMPVGVLVPFAGQRDAAVPDGGHWRVCHGAAVRDAEAPDLFDAIGFAHGQADTAAFVLPDYRGWFQRGVAGEARADPDAEVRTCAYPAGRPSDWQGNTGNKVGSAQAFATGAPQVPFRTTTVPKLPDSDADKRVAGFMYNLLRRGGGTLSVALSLDGGDAETRPVNVSVDWYVLSEPTAPQDPGFPVGAVAAMGGTLADSDWWLPADGRTLTVTDHKALYAAIGNTYGGDATSFALPDYRGRFLRGASYDTGVDPDSAKRSASGAVSPGGVGTVQDYATGRPVVPFVGSIARFPDGELGAHGVTNGGNAGNGGFLTFATCTAGGDEETRPRNVYLNVYIRVA